MNRSSLWRQIRALPGARIEVPALVAASVVSGLSEAALLAIVAQAAVAISTKASALKADVVGLRQLSHITVPQLLVIGVGLAVLRLVAQVAQAWLPSKLNADLQVNLRARLLTAFLGASWGAKAGLADGHLQEAATALTDRASGSAQILGMGLSASINFCALVLSAFLIGPLIALITGATAVVLFFVLRPLVGRTRHSAEAFTTAHAAYADAASEMSRLGQEFEVFNANTAGVARLAASSEAVRKPFLRRTFLLGLLPGAYQSLALTLILGGLAGLYLVGSTHLASLGAVALLLIRSFAYSQQAQAAYQQVSDLLPAADAVEAIIAAFEAEPAPAGGERLDHIADLELLSVTFAYRDREPALHDVSTRVSAGDAVGIVGTSGAGKSTLLQILLRLRSPSEGEYLVNGRPAAATRLEDWWRLVSYVPQDTQLLTGTVADNIRFFRSMSDDDVVAAAKSAHLHDEILALPEGYETALSPRAAALSGGQRQRLCLARALAGKPEMLILDEPTSSLDNRSEELIQQTLLELKGKVTLIIVAHRQSTLTLCDRILRMQGGYLVADEPVGGSR